MAAFLSIFIFYVLQQFSLDYDCTTCPAGQSFGQGRGFICQSSFTQGRDVNTCWVVDYLPINIALWSCSLCRPGNVQGQLNLSGGSIVLWCLPCSISNCENCDGDINGCSSCKSGYFLKTGSPPTCKPCPRKCAICISLTKCTSCKNLLFV
jgi:hypothetical protein